MGENPYFVFVLHADAVFVYYVPGCFFMSYAVLYGLYLKAKISLLTGKCNIF